MAPEAPVMPTTSGNSISRTPGYAAPMAAEISGSNGSRKPLGGRGDLGDEVAQQRFVGERGQGHFARLEPRGAGVDGLAIQLDHAFLAGIGVDAGEADGE